MSPRDERPRNTLARLFDEMPPEAQAKGRAVVRLLESMIYDYHDCKGNPCLSLEDHAKSLGMSLEDARAANRSIERIDFVPAEYLARGFTIPEVAEYTDSLVYRLRFPGRTLIYIDRAELYLDESNPPEVYAG